MEQSNEQDDLLAIRFLLKHKKKLIVYTLSAAILSTVITFSIPNEYYSYGIVFPPANPSLDNSIDNPNFGYDVEADRLVQIFQSKEIRDSVIKHFDLITYYGLDKTNPEWLDKLEKKYRNDIRFDRTPYMSIVMSAQTKSPEMSANIVNYILDASTNVRERIYKSNVLLGYKEALSEYEKQKELVAKLLTSIKTDVETLHLPGLLLLASNAQINFSLNQLNNNEKSQDKNLELGANILKFKHEQGKLNELSGKVDRIKKILQNPVPSIYVVDKATPSYKKVFPSFSINIVLSVIATFIFSCIVLFLREKIENIARSLK